MTFQATPCTTAGRALHSRPFDRVDPDRRRLRGHRPPRGHLRPRGHRGPAAAAWAALLLAALLVAPAAAAAQTVVGRVVEEGTMRPLGGAFVVLEDSAGTRQNGGLAGADGRYVLRARVPGRYRLVVELIGYASTATEPLELRPGATVERTIEVPVQAVTLDGIEVETESRCRRRPGSGPATARLWEEARKALELARWSEGQGILRFGVAEHRRVLDAATLRVLEQEEAGRSGLYDRSPYVSIPAGDLEGGGYVQRTPEGGWVYYGPDAAVLLSESFLRTHCFRVQAPARAEAGLVGLGFEPVPERDRPDIRGVLWLERGTAELKRLDFTFVQLPFEHGDWRQVGGRVEFERLATGMWVVRRWWLRMPLEARAVGGHGRSLPELRLVTLHETGAEIRSIQTRDGRLLDEAAGATLYGAATTAEGEPLAGATVAVAAADRSTRTGDDGAFRLTGLPAGTWAVRLSHPDLELAGVGPVTRVAELAGGQARRLPLEVRLDAGAAATVCGGGGGGGGGGASGAASPERPRSPSSSTAG